MTTTVTLPTAVGGDGYTYTDGVGDDVTLRGMDNGGHARWFVPMVSAVLGMVNYMAAAVTGLLASAATSATSVTNITPTVASKALTIQAGKAWVQGMWVMVASAAAPSTNWGMGQITSYSGTALVVDMVLLGSAPAAATDWQISLSGPPLSRTTALLDVSQAIKYTGVISPAQITADQNDYAPPNFATATRIRINSDASRVITGLAGGADGRTVILENVGSFRVGLTANDAASAAANRFKLPFKVWLQPNTAVELEYDATSTSWRAKSPVWSAGRQSVWIPAGAMVSRTTNGPSSGSVETTTNKVMINSWDFDASTIEYVQFTVRMPKQWDLGVVRAVFAWDHAATATNFKVSWGINAVSMGDGDAGDAAFGTAIYANDIGGTTNMFYASPETTDITVAGTPQAEDLVVFQPHRKADDAVNDTLAIDARLRGVTLHLNSAAGNDE